MEIKRNMNKKEYAHILRLLDEPRQQGVKRKVFRTDQEKNYKDIDEYLKKNKNKRLKTRLQLIACISPAESPPSHISYEDTINEMDELEPNRAASAHVRNAGGPSNYLHPVSNIDATRDQSPSGTTGSHVPGLWRSPAEASQSITLATSFQDLFAQPSFEGDPVMNNEDMNVQTSSGAYESSRQQTPQEELASDMNRLLNGVQMQNPLRQSVDFYANVSATPPMHSETTWSVPMQRSARRLRNKQVQSKVEMLQEARKFIGSTDTAGAFVAQCHCICSVTGQGQHTFADALMDVAMGQCQSFLRRHPQEIMPTFHLLTVMLDAYGHNTLGVRILDRLLRICKTDGHGESIMASIEFMKDTLARKSGPESGLNSDRMRRICDSLSALYGQFSRSALTAQYNLAWALMTEGKLQQAADLLGTLRSQFEQVFGAFHIQTISCQATLSRTYLKLNMLENAKCLFDEAFVRLRTQLPPFHPYLLEAQTRQAGFLIAAHEEEEAEKMLRLVLHHRYRVLGPQNPRSHATLEQLKDLLKDQGREDELSQLVDQIINDIQENTEAP